jgi:integrase/recombinase XerD
MASVFKRGKKYHAAFVAADGKWRSRSTGTTDKAVAQRLAHKWETDASQRRGGLIDPTLDSLAHANKRAIAEHLADYESHLRSKGNSADYLKQAPAMIRKAIDACGWKAIAEISAVRFTQHLNGMKAAGKSARTVNAHRMAVRGFTRWLTVEARIKADPLLNVPKLNEATDRKRVRRALSDEEIARLIDAADASGVERYGLDGKARAMLYRTALGTGFRLNELQSLTPRSFNLDGEPPTITVEAGYSKRRRRDVQPIRADLAESLAPWLEGFDSAAKPWKAGHDARAARMIAADLRGARAVWIRSAGADWHARQERRESCVLRAVDAAGRVADFHALRHTFITRLARAGVPAVVAKNLARHSTITLTMDRYSHVGLVDELAALNALPAVAVKAEPVVLAATGTDDQATSSNDPAERIAAHLQRAQAPTSQPMPSPAIAGKIGGGGCGSRKPRKLQGLAAARHDLSTHVTKAAGGSRIRNLQITNQVLCH